MGRFTGDFAIDALILAASALCSCGAALLWWSVRRNIAALDGRQNGSDAAIQSHTAALSEYRERLAVIEDRIGIRRN